MNNFVKSFGILQQRKCSANGKYLSLAQCTHKHKTDRKYLLSLRQGNIHFWSTACHSCSSAHSTASYHSRQGSLGRKGEVKLFFGWKVLLLILVSTRGTRKRNQHRLIPLQCEEEWQQWSGGIAPGSLRMKITSVSYRVERHEPLGSLWILDI